MERLIQKYMPHLKVLADWRTILFLSIQLSLLVINWQGSWRSGFTVTLSFPMAFLCCIVMHNHVHTPTFRGQFWNHVFQIVLTFATGRPPTSILTAHKERHHKHLDSEKDFVRSSLVQSKWNSWNLLVFPFLSIIAMRREKSPEWKKWRKNRPALFRQAVRENCLFYVIVAVLVFLRPLETLCFLMLPWLFGQLVMVGINLLQHQDCDVNSEYNHSRNLTGKAANWFLLNNGFHTAHHLKPTRHWSLLRDYHEKEVAPEMNPELNFESFLKLLWERLNRTEVQT